MLLLQSSSKLLKYQKQLLFYQTLVSKTWKKIIQRNLSTSPCLFTKQEKLKHSYDHFISHHKLISKTIGSLIDDTTEKYSHHQAVVFYDDNKYLTFTELNEQAEQMAASLLALDLQLGDRVGMWGQNHLEWVITLYAVAKAGLILVNVNPAYKPKELEYALNKVEMKALIMMPTFKTTDYYEILREVVPEIEFSQPGKLRSERVPSLKHVIVTDGPNKSGTFSFKDFVNFGGSAEQHQVNKLKNKISFDDPVNIQFTSGTTGFPKGTTLTHHNLINNAFIISTGLGYTQSDRVCIPVPLSHSFGMVLGSLCSMTAGATQIYTGKGFNPKITLEAIQNKRCTSILSTPAMFIDLLNHPEFDNYNYTSLRTGVMGGSPCPIEVMEEVIEKMNCKEITIAYGLTETSPITNMTSRNIPIELRCSTVGKIIPHTEVKVIDENGKIVPLNTTGELCYRGHHVFQGYWEDENKTKEAIDANGWFHTGDLGSIDENGYVRINGRLKDMVIRGGENIYPNEVENFLYKHPKIEVVQIVGVPDKRMGEELCAWIRLKRNVNATNEEIREFCKGQIAHFKIPRYIEFVDEYPMTASGKIKKNEIRKEMIQRLGTKLVSCGVQT